MAFVSDLLVVLKFTSSASAALIRDCSCPLERKASARSLLICAVPSFADAGAAGSRGFASAADGLADFSASRAAVRSKRLVTMEC
jgi:hypothetical protein